MRLFSKVLFLILALLPFCSAVELRVRVIDPTSAAISGAHVALYSEGARLLAQSSTTSMGTANLPVVYAGSQLRIEAAGFSPYVHVLTSVPDETLEVKLQVQSAAETVVVAGDATPISEEKGSARVSSFDLATLTLLNLPELSDNLRLAPGAYLSDTGQRGGLTTMFVRGGQSTYNKVIIDGVPVNENTGSSGSFNFGGIPTYQISRVEMARGAESTLYGSDAMTSLTQVWTASGSTHLPELRVGSEGGTFSTARGYASLAGARTRFDYNLFADQFQTDGQGLNGSYESATQGANLGFNLNDTTGLRLSFRHTNSRSGVPGDWYPELGVPANPDAYVRQNDLIGSLALTFSPARTWQNTLTGFEYNHILQNVNLDPASLTGRPGDMLSDSRDHFNRAGFDYLGQVTERSWSRSLFGFHFEDENAYLSDEVATTFSHGIRRNIALYGEQIVDWNRVTLTGGVRWEHNETFGDRAVPRAAASVVLLRGRSLFSGTRLRASVADGIKAPTFEQNLGISAFGTVPNSNIKPEKARALEAGLTQGLFNNRWTLSAVYFHNRFTDQIEWEMLASTDPACVAAGYFYCSQYLNSAHVTAQGTELELRGRVTRKLSLNGSYTYTSIATLDSNALLRRPKHFGTAMAAYVSSGWGASLSGSFVGRRADMVYQMPAPIYVARTVNAGYARLDTSAYRNITHRVTLYATVQNLLNHKYCEVAGYPAYRANFRAGMRFRLGGES